MIVSKQRIQETYEDIYGLHKNDAERIAAVSKMLGVSTDAVVQVIYQIEVEA
ncbi:hypothetical protein [Undibacterium baiyunense]|uniref:Uncharacterized protein n=1 Tax=Undibacterium baiyunense TaxID=2828731 RepID=A0A941DES9_9BURK|nr:hypothetical protein [Undibacterium baiyunense]MBR7747419.1 hypothetical protein [Undibacterium baiyunense]